MVATAAWQSSLPVWPGWLAGLLGWLAGAEGLSVVDFNFQFSILKSKVES